MATWLFVPLVCGLLLQVPVDATGMRQQRQVDSVSRGKPDEIRRAVSMLSYPDNLDIKSGFFPKLMQDKAATCYWRENKQHMVYDMAIVDLGVPLLGHFCTTEEQCKNQCLEMHEDGDYELCNYLTWSESTNTAMFYSLDPVKPWPLKHHSSMRSFEWRCRPNGCKWFWRPQQVVNKLDKCIRCKLLTTTFCRDFGHCQRQCETIPTCNHLYMPNNGTEGYGRLYHVPEEYMQHRYYDYSDRYDSFEMRCDKTEPQHPATDFAAVSLPSEVSNKLFRVQHGSNKWNKGAAVVGSRQ